ncbi:MAG: GNAT family N-acetyltransferase [Oscillospiraceae bacterium]|nr:GNAT family N-acetyltransferase [Oscillospiraceae bacterium]
MIIRPPAGSEYEQVVNCLIEARGTEYYSAEYYNARWLEANIEIFAAFDDNGELKGVSGLSRGLFNDHKTTGCLLTVRPGFTGNGMGIRLVSHFTDVLRGRGAGTVKGQAATTHTAAQRITERLGWTPTGFLPGARHGKNALVLYTGNLSVKDAGTLYIHDEIAGPACWMYDKLGVKADIKTNGQPGETRVCCVRDAHNRTVYIHALECGADLPKEQAIVALNLRDPSAVYGYESLRQNGFCFCGFDPLGQYEHAILYKGKAESDMQLTGQAEKMKQEAERI